MASQRETFNTAVQHLSSICQHLQACFNGVDACKSIFERYEYAYRLESGKLRDIREQYAALASDNQYYEKMFHQYEDIHQGTQECMQSSEDRNREYESKIKELERENQEAKEKLSAAFARFKELEGKVVRSPVQQSPTISKRQRSADMDNLEVPLEPEKKRGRARKHRKVMNEAQAEA